MTTSSDLLDLVPVPAPAISASRLKGVLACPRRAALDQEFPPRARGDAAWAGILVHQALERCAGRLVTGVDVLAEVDLLVRLHPPGAVARARELAAQIGELDLRDTDLVEHRFTGLAVGIYKANGVVDRVDVSPSAGGGQRVQVLDYKTGAVQTRDELERAPQTILYLAWAASEYAIGEHDDLSMAYSWPAAGIKIRIGYNPADVARGLAAAEKLWGDYLSADEHPATPTPGWCGHCDHRATCPALAEEIERPRGRPEWEDLDLGELITLRHQLHQDSGMLEGLRRDVDAEIMDQLSSADLQKYGTEDHTASVTSRASTTYDAAVLADLAELIPGVVGRVATVSTTKLKRALADLEGEERERATRLVEHYASRTRGAEYLLVRSKGGLF